MRKGMGKEKDIKTERKLRRLREREQGRKGGREIKEKYGTRGRKINESEGREERRKREREREREGESKTRMRRM